MDIISIHALLAESDHQWPGGLPKTEHFYPRSPCGERRINRDIANGEREFLSTLSLRRATWANFSGFYWWVISIHALLAESDTRRTYQQGEERAFLSTLSLRRATVTVLGIQHKVGISIHALLAESDAVQIVIIVVHTLFLSTLSLRRATDQ